MKLLLTTVKNDCIHTKLALKYLYSIVADSPVDVVVKEYEEDDGINEIYEDIVRGGYDMTYFHCNMLNEAKIDILCEMVKKATPTSIVAVGGMQVSFDTREYMLANPAVDFVFRGEGEAILFNFVKTIVTYEFGFDNIAGLAYRENDEVYVNPLEAPIRFEDVPFPYEKAELDSKDMVFYESFRGCPDRCAYSQFLPDSRIRALSLNRVCTELRYFIVKNVKQVRFVDKWFNYNTERAYRIWEYLINNDNGVTSFVFDVNGDLLDEESIRMLARARKGMFEFNIDIESTNAAPLASVGRKENIYQLMYNVSKLLQSGNIKVNVFLRAGLPFETTELFERSFNKAYGLGASTFNVEVLKLRKGTLLREEADKYGYFYSSAAPYEVISNDFMTAPELIKIKTVAAIADKYMGDGGFAKSVPRVMGDMGIKPFELFDRLTDYILMNGLLEATDRKEELYRILYSFATGVYDEMNNTLKLPILMEIIHSDLENDCPAEVVRKFDKRGWDIDGQVR